MFKDEWKLWDRLMNCTLGFELDQFTKTITVVGEM